MTRKDYIKLAKMFKNAIISNQDDKELRGHNKNMSNNTDNIICNMINEVIEICENDNPRFNEETFRDAISK